MRRYSVRLSSARFGEEFSQVTARTAREAADVALERHALRVLEEGELHPQLVDPEAPEEEPEPLYETDFRPPDLPENPDDPDYLSRSGDHFRYLGARSIIDTPPL